MRYFLSIVVLFFAVSTVVATTDTLAVKDCLTDAYFYSNETGKYVPLVDAATFEGNTIHFKVEEPQTGQLWLRIQSSQDVALFMGQKLLEEIQADQTAYLNFDSLADAGQLQFALYNRRLSARNLKVDLVTFQESKASFSTKEDVVVISQRKRHVAFSDFFIIGLIVLCIFLAALYNYYPRVTRDFLRFSRALAMREIDENIFKSRPFSWINILFYFFFSLLTAYLLICIFYLAPFEMKTEFNGVFSIVWMWLQVASIVLGWLLGKFILIRNFTSLFSIKNFLPSHYFNYVRIGFLIFMFSGVVMVISYLGFDITSSSYYKTLFTLLLIAISLRSLFLMLKLMNTASYKFLHLFSYLCGTEFIPLGILLFLGFNQPF